MAPFYSAMLVIGALAVFGDQFTTWIHASQGVRIAGDPGRYEKNGLPKFFLRRFGAAKGLILYYPIELGLLFGLTGGSYYGVSFFFQERWQQLYGSVMMITVSGVFIYIMVHNTRKIAEVNRLSPAQSVDNLTIA